MKNPEIEAAKMICKSIDALTREIYLIRKAKEEKQKISDYFKGDRRRSVPVGSPPPHK